MHGSSRRGYRQTTQVRGVLISDCSNSDRAHCVELVTTTMHKSAYLESREHGYDLQGRELRGGINAYWLGPQYTSRSPGVMMHCVLVVSPTAGNSPVL